MFVADKPGGEGPHCPVCKSCGLLIEGHSDEIDASDTDHGDTSGIYHPECAEPIHKLLRTIRAVQRGFGRGM